MAAPMNVVHVNASDRRGGAALAVHRLHQALRAEAVDSHLLVEDKGSTDASVEALPLQESVARRYAEAIETGYVKDNRTDISNTHFSLSLNGPDLSRHPAVRSADVIHLHWVASIQTPASIGRLLQLGKPVVWTLHDFGPFTGGCHFPAGCRGFEDSCRACPQLRSDPFGVPAAVLQDKKALWPLDNLTLITPSHWLARKVRQSALFRNGVRLEVIPNGVDCRVFRPRPQAEARAALGIPSSGTYVLCGTDQGLEMRKGLEMLRPILADCLHDRRFLSAGGRILSLGEPPPTWSEAEWPLTSLGPISDERRVALAYAAADLFVLPSVEDNLPNMMLEALGSGRPVVAFDVGGISEVVRDGWSGRIVAALDAEGMRQAILDLVGDPQQRAAMGENARSSIEKDYSTSSQAVRHLSLYTELRDQTSARPPLASGELVVHDPSDPGPTVSALLPDLTVHSLYEAWRCAEADRAARLRVIEEQQRQLEQLRADRGRWQKSLEKVQVTLKRFLDARN